MEELCSTASPQRHLILTVYALLFGEIDHKSNTVIQKWESELKLDLPKEEWDSIYEHIHKGSINISAQENGYKLYSRWYHTPERTDTHIPPNCITDVLEM